MSQATLLKSYEVKVWEKAEHWYFYVTVQAVDEAAAWKQARKDWSKREYTIQEVR